MTRLASVVVVALVLAACISTTAFVPLGERSSGAKLAWDVGETEASGSLLAFDPRRHTLDIAIVLPIDQPDDVDVYIVTTTGIRYKVLGSFHNCRQEDSVRLCTRNLPMFFDEGIENWRVEATRGDARQAASVRVDVTWVPVPG